MDEFDILDYLDTGSGILPMQIENIVGGGSTANVGTPINRPYGSSSGGSEVAGGGFAFPLALGLGTGTVAAGSGLLASSGNQNLNKAEQRSQSRMNQRGDLFRPQQDFYDKYISGRKSDPIGKLFRPVVKEKLGIESKNTGSPFKGTAPPISKTTTTEAGPNFDLTDIDQLMKPDVPPKTFKQKIGGVLNNVMDAINNPAQNEQFYRGLRAYIDGKNGLTIGETLLKESKLSKEQYKTMFDNAYKLSQIRKNNAYADAQDAKALGTDNVNPGAKLAAGLTYGQGLIPQIENRITAEYFPGVDKDTIPARQISSLASMLTQDVNEMITGGMGLNEAIDRAMKIAESQGALSKGKIQERRFMFDKKIPPRADASKYTERTFSMKALLAANKGSTEEEVRAAVNARPNSTLID
tara:strand:+ start:526 stop:1755 length:1230 start_codon:yes stop_codon:yes gene_type:complete